MSSKKSNYKLRSREWFDNPEDPGNTSIYLERIMNYGYTPEELTSGKPIIGIAQTGSDISPCNRIHLKLAERIREGIRSAGGIAFEFPVHPIQETLTAKRFPKTVTTKPRPSVVNPRILHKNTNVETATK